MKYTLKVKDLRNTQIKYGASGNSYSFIVNKTKDGFSQLPVVLETDKPEHKIDLAGFKKDPVMMIQEGLHIEIYKYGKPDKKKGEGS